MAHNSNQLNFDSIIQSYDTIMENYKNMDIDFDSNDNKQHHIQIEDDNIKFYVDHIIQAKKNNVDYFLPEDLPFEQIVQILEMVQQEEDKEQRENKIKLERELREEQDREYEEALQRDIEKELQKEELKAIKPEEIEEEIEEENIDNKILSREELRQARLKFYCK